MKIAQLINTKGHDAFSISAQLPLRDAIAEMMAHRIGALLVMKGEELLGVISERDILGVVNDDPAAVATQAVADVMTLDPITCHMEMEIDEAMDLLFHNRTQRRIRHLPVMEGDKVVGVISIGDLVEAQLEMSRFENRLLKNYIKNWPDEGDGG